MIRVRVDVFVEVIEGGRIGLTGTCTSSDRLWVLLPRWGERMLVGGICASAGATVVTLSAPTVARINNSFLIMDGLLSGLLAYTHLSMEAYSEDLDSL